MKSHFHVRTVVEVSFCSPSLVFPTTPFTLVEKQPFHLKRDESWNKSSCTFSIKKKQKTDFQVQVLLMRIKTKTLESSDLFSVCHFLFVYDGTSSWPTFSPRFCYAEILGLALFFFLWLRWSLDKSFMFSISNGCVPPTLTQHFKIVASVLRWAWVRPSRPDVYMNATKNEQPHITVCLSLMTLSQPRVVVVFFSLSPSHAFSWNATTATRIHVFVTSPSASCLCFSCEWRMRFALSSNQSMDQHCSCNHSSKFYNLVFGFFLPIKHKLYTEPSRIHLSVIV